tara:strand:- start:55 stop:300 length:246 start_codon:yes stop_codon:yes gene_type:complete
MSKELKYNAEDLEKVMSFKSWSDKKKVDTLLHIDCTMYCNLGLDSSNRERTEVKTKSRSIYRAIKTINPTLGKFILDSMDR